MDQYEYSHLMAELKKRLKNYGLSQKQVATFLNVPESTIRKWFMAKDGSLSRINRICGVLGISLQDLVNSLAQERLQTVQFTAEHEKVFKTFPQDFSLYWLLAYERKSAQEAAQSLKLTDHQLRASLNRLDRARLLKLLPSDQVRLPRLRPVRWALSKGHIRSIFQSWTMGILSESLEAYPGTSLALQYFQLTEDSYDELMRDLRKIEEKYARRTISEMRSSLPIAHRVRYLQAISKGSFIKSN